jgi:molybdopterin-containing oxidoreductase family iron-sulfur binding subunit
LEAPELEVERRAAELVFGTADLPFFDIARAEYVLSIGAPILDRWRSPVHYTRAFADMRRARPTRRGRFVQAEARMSLTAANADEWLPVRPGTEGVFARAIGGLTVARGGMSPAAAQRYRTLFTDGNPFHAAPSLEDAAERCDVPAERIQRIAEDLMATESAVVIAGGSAAGHTNGLYNTTAGLALNLLLDNLGTPGGVFSPATLPLAQGIAPANRPDTPLWDVVGRLAGEGTPVDLLILSEVDLVHAVPAIATSVGNVGTVIALSSFLDDSASQADLVLPLATELERFEAHEAPTSVGVAAFGLAEPVVEAMGDGPHPADVLLQVARGLGAPVAGQFEWASFEALVRARVAAELARLPGGSGTTAGPFVTAALNRGGIFGGGAPAGAPRGPTGAAPSYDQPFFEGDSNEFALTLLPFESVKAGDGRGANRPWLQEHPDPLSTVMWGSWVEISPADARDLGVEDGDRVRVESPAGSVETHAVVDPAVRPGVVCMPMGHGHANYGRYAQGRGANVMALLGQSRVFETSAYAWSATRVRVTRLGEGDLVRFGRRYEGGEPAGADPGGLGASGHVATRPRRGDERMTRWGMAIDTDRCTGCGACAVACHAENNIQTVGEVEAAKGRAMHWMRIERYYEGVFPDVKVRFQPVLCQHCAHAPCEPVCPVYATYRTPEGLNAMVYSRCIGTRYCANNCPYTVRYFNWFTPEFPSPLERQLNPNVSVRPAGVMEKCTFCVQRIQDAQEVAAQEDREVRDGEIRTACSQSCPARAITFGDLDDPESAVAQLARTERASHLLEDLSTEPSVIYLRGGR